MSFELNSVNFGFDLRYPNLPFGYKDRSLVAYVFLFEWFKFWQSTNTGWNWWLLGWSGVVHFPLIKKLGRTFITGQGLVELYDLYRSLLLQNALFVMMIYLIMYLYTFPSLFLLSFLSLCCKYVVVLIGWFCLLKLLFDITLVSYHLFLFYLFCSPDGICMWSNLVCIFFFCK